MSKISYGIVDYKWSIKSPGWTQRDKEVKTLRVERETQMLCCSKVLMPRYYLGEVEAIKWWGRIFECTLTRTPHSLPPSGSHLQNNSTYHSSESQQLVHLSGVIYTFLHAKLSQSLLAGLLTRTHKATKEEILLAQSPSHRINTPACSTLKKFSRVYISLDSIS